MSESRGSLSRPRSSRGCDPLVFVLISCPTMGGQIGNFDQSGVDSEGMPTSLPFATSRPGIFAVGDVRRGSVKRVASGVGEGSVVIHAVHKFLNPDGGGGADGRHPSTIFGCGFRSDRRSRV